MGLLAPFLFCHSAKAQFSFSQIEYYIGTGSDTALLVVDFKDGSADSSYAWGYLFNGNTDGQTMLQEVTAADENFTASIAGGFLNDIIYGQHQGLGGQPDFWSTWTGTDTASLSMNAGIGTSVNPGEWFALSYTDFNPAAKPGLPIPAFNPNAFSFNDVKTWVGSGADSAILVIDFLNQGDSYAWGILFNDSTTGGAILNNVATADSNLSVNASGFLNDLRYKQDSGIGGAPNFWGTWSGTNLGNWFLNSGISTTVKNGDFFGCSYTNFAPALRPNVPTAVDYTVGLSQNKTVVPSLYPNPTRNFVNVPQASDKGGVLKVYSLRGEKVIHLSINKAGQANTQALKQGVYLVEYLGGFSKLAVQ